MISIRFATNLQYPWASQFDANDRHMLAAYNAMLGITWLPESRLPSRGEALADRLLRGLGANSVVVDDVQVPVGGAG